METAKFAHLWLLLAAALLAVGASSPSADAEALRHWLADPEAREGLMDLWSKGRSPLEAVFAAVNASSKAHDRLFLPISSYCALDVSSMLNTRALWAFSMLDASVKIPVGLLAQVFTQLGNWDECVDQRDIPSALGTRTFHGQMCMVKLKPQVTRMAGAGVADFSLAPTSDRILRNDPGTAALLSYIQISLGMCMPSSCSARDVQTIFAQIINKLKNVPGIVGNVPVGIELVASVYDSDCTTRDPPSLEHEDYVAVGLLSFLAALVVVSTVYDVVTPKDKFRPLPAAFSVVTNGRKLLALPRSDGDHTLSCLHGIRFLSMCWVVLGHRYLASIMAPSVNPSFRNNIITKFSHLFLTNATLSVDTFFVLSGLLLGYLFFKQDPSKRRLNVPLYYLHRYIRLTPALAVLILISATLLIRVGWGPLWTDTFSAEQKVCRETWWKTLIYLGNYVNPLEMCAEHTWYLMVDMQLHWLSPLVILPLVRFPKAGFTWILFLSAAGIVWNFCFFYLQDLPATPLTTFDDPDLVAYTQKYYYYPTHTRFVPYLIGVATGYILAINQRNGKLKRLPLLFSALGWLLASACMLLAFLLFYIFFHPPYPSQLVASFYSCLNRPVWGLGVALIVYLCASGSGGGANSFLSWWGFHVLGRLSYSVYLVHGAIIGVTGGSKKTLIQLGDSSILVQFASDLLISLFFAMILSLVCESPFLVLEKELLGSSRKKRQPSLPTSTLQPSNVSAAFVSESPKHFDDGSVKPLANVPESDKGNLSNFADGQSSETHKDILGDGERQSASHIEDAFSEETPEYATVMTKSSSDTCKEPTEELVSVVSGSG